MDKDSLYTNELEIRISTLQNLLTKLTYHRYKYAVDAYGDIALEIRELRDELSRSKPTSTTTSSTGNVRVTMTNESNKG